MDFGLASFITPLYNLGKDLHAWFKTHRKKHDPLALLEVRRKWRTEFEQHLNLMDHAPTYGDAIIRDISRMDVYPDIDSKRKGISPWFKVEVKGLYHRGVEVFLRIESAKYEESIQSWRWADYDEPGAINVWIVGKIPFEIVKAVEWDGDQYYYAPHIYCENAWLPRSVRAAWRSLSNLTAPTSLIVGSYARPLHSSCKSIIFPPPYGRGDSSLAQPQPFCSTSFLLVCAVSIGAQM